ncbi:DNA-directed DNA polymerase [Methanocella arvoryzae]|uniref:DNA polymerase n=1 Tax=Methanocella arvoryzae (strain DSM 22066 / NBRC 105507 / MRE50) TaxID=351160 RepID=Q0W0J7_METAR|nr:DNA-directed DNA polymerase [Methanocella arvoryzae]CAJ38096.1 DNA-directed DNA polymerase B [Methanocella arvoryzae MRE50]
MKFHGWLLDVDYVVENDRPVIRMWCIDDEGRSAVLFDRTFEPYFYVVPYGDVPINTLENIADEVGGEIIRPVRVDVVDRKNFGVPVKAYRLFTRLPRDVPYLREIAKRYGDVREADILFGVRYIIDKRLIPMGGIEAEGEPVEVDYVDIALNCEQPKGMPRDGEPPVKIMAFDCEMFNPRGMPNAKEDPIVLISICTGNQVRILEASNQNDKQIIKDFIAFIDEYDPDIIVGYNQDSFDWPYIIERAKRHKIKLNVSRDGSTPLHGRGGLQKKVKLIGRLNVDLYQVAARDVDGVKIKTLDNIADYVGVMKKDERVNLSGVEIYQYWLDPERRKDLIAYSRDDVVSTYGLAKELLPLQYEFTRMIHEPLDNVSKMGRGRQVEAYLAYIAYEHGELIPSRAGEVETYAGGFVFEPVKGLHKNVAALDFSAMYPSIMIAYNISPDTVCEAGDQDCSEPAPEVGYRFKKQPEGFFTTILKNLVTHRSTLKKRLAQLDRKSNEYRMLDLRQKSIKILTNAFYGYTGWAQAKWYRRECAEATSAWGRYFIKKANDIAIEMGLQVLYGDTDSLFVEMEDNKRLMDVVRQYIQRVKAELPLDMDIDNVYRIIFFTESKKRYAGLTDRGEIVVRGLEVRRGDWCEIAKELQSEVIRIILEEENPDKAAKFVKDTVQKVKSGKVPLDALVIHKTLTKSVTRYESAQAHVKAAERAMERDMAAEIGNKISYVIVKGTGTLSDRAYPVDMFHKFKDSKLYAKDKTYEIDADYYVDKQLIPTALRILGYFGYTEDALKGRSVQGTLESFF